MEQKALELAINRCADLEGDISQAAEEAEEMILHHCNLDVLPAGLYNTLAKLARDIMEQERTARRAEEMRQDGSVKSIRMGDTTIDLDTQQLPAVLTERELLAPYAAKLARFRRFQW